MFGQFSDEISKHPVLLPVLEVPTRIDCRFGTAKPTINSTGIIA
jgi:hypothetical protein